MLGSSFGSVSSSLRRTSANDRSDEIFTCSTAMVCDAKVACAVVWVMCALHIMGGIGFLNDLFYGRSYSGGPAELSIPFLLDEKSTVVPVRLAGEQSGGKRKASYRDARSNSERAAPSACVGRRFSPPQIVWNKSTPTADGR